MQSYFVWQLGDSEGLLEMHLVPEMPQLHVVANPVSDWAFFSSANETENNFKNPWLKEPKAWGIKTFLPFPDGVSWLKHNDNRKIIILESRSIWRWSEWGVKAVFCPEEHFQVSTVFWERLSQCFLLVSSMHSTELGHWTIDWTAVSTLLLHNALSITWRNCSWSWKLVFHVSKFKLTWHLILFHSNEQQGLIHSQVQHNAKFNLKR